MPLIRHDAEYVTYSRPQLALVVCQLRFAPILRLASPGGVAALQEFLRDDYPTLSRVGGVELRLGPQGMDAEVDESAGGWSFATSDDERQIVVSADSLVLQTRRHATYEALRTEFERILAYFASEYRPAARHRLGLRYVNRLIFDEAEALSDWRRLVRPELLGMTATDALAADDNVRHSFGQSRFACTESQIIARYGFMEQGVTTDPAVEPSTHPSFLLDIDHFDVRRFDEVSVPFALEQLDDFHQDIHRIFDWCLSDAAREFLGAGDSERVKEVKSG